MSTMLVWPLPALLTWALAWAVFAALRVAGATPMAAFGVALLAGAGCALLGRTAWRRLFMAGGFPLSALASGLLGASLPAWAWLLPLALLAALYPVNTWRDAPLFPTPPQALDGLARRIVLADGARVVDAGCGLGHGLRALHREYPRARLTGWEWSRPIAGLCRLSCRFAEVERADIWAQDWAPFDLVYLFQRPESMPRAMDKAGRQLRAGAWLVSLEFEAPGWAPQGQLKNVEGKPVWLYQAPFRRR